MPFEFGGLALPLMVATGAVAVTGGAFYYYNHKMKKQPKLIKTSVEVKQASGKFFTKENLLLNLVKTTRGDNKMVFVVNRPLLNNKQHLFLTVSTACLKCYQVAMKNGSNEHFMKSWLRQGQMKVVLKSQTGQELLNVSEKATSVNLPCVLLKSSDIKCLSFKDSSVDDYVVACLVGPAKDLDTITGHLKLL